MLISSIRVASGSLDQLLGRGRAPPTDIGAPVLHKFFHDKIAAVHAATAEAAKPTYTTGPPGCELRLFMPVTQTDVAEMVRALSDKQCLSDSLPTWLLKANVDLLAPVLCHTVCVIGPDCGYNASCISYVAV